MTVPVSLSRAIPYGTNSSQAFPVRLNGAVIGVITVITLQVLKSSSQGTTRDSLTKPVTVNIAKATESEFAARFCQLALLYKFANTWAIVVLVAAGAEAE